MAALLRASSYNLIIGATSSKKLKTQSFQIRSILIRLNLAKNVPRVSTYRLMESVWGMTSCKDGGHGVISRKSTIIRSSYFLAGRGEV